MFWCNSTLGCSSIWFGSTRLQHQKNAKSADGVVAVSWCDEPQRYRRSARWNKVQEILDKGIKQVLGSPNLQTILSLTKRFAMAVQTSMPSNLLLLLEKLE